MNPTYTFRNIEQDYGYFRSELTLIDTLPHESAKWTLVFYLPKQISSDLNILSEGFALSQTSYGEWGLRVEVVSTAEITQPASRKITFSGHARNPHDDLRTLTLSPQSVSLNGIFVFPAAQVRGKPDTNVITPVPDYTNRDDPNRRMITFEGVSFIAFVHPIYRNILIAPVERSKGGGWGGDYLPTVELKQQWLTDIYGQIDRSSSGPIGRERWERVNRRVQLPRPQPNETLKEAILRYSRDELWKNGYFDAAGSDRPVANLLILCSGSADLEGKAGANYCDPIDWDPEYGAAGCIMSLVPERTFRTERGELPPNGLIPSHEAGHTARFLSRELRNEIVKLHYEGASAEVLEDEGNNVNLLELREMNGMDPNDSPPMETGAAKEALNRLTALMNEALVVLPSDGEEAESAIVSEVATLKRELIDPITDDMVGQEINIANGERVDKGIRDSYLDFECDEYGRVVEYELVNALDNSYGADPTGVYYPECSLSAYSRAPG
ncbi:hypothetical protein [Streptomyces sp. NPDC001404]|uniref:hypothetical protein n=1 Tax=Streptomyces sp. NPDC001404 TaxID=3364571 RepID=UPI00368BA313